MRARGCFRFLAFGASVDVAGVALLAALGVGVWVVSVAAQGGRASPPQGLLLEPIGQAGEAIYPAFEGWGPTKDGGQVLLLGYFNRNKEQALDIPIGPNNRIEPGGPDYGQPTHFHTGRQYGVFAIPIPKDFGNRRLTWTLVANGHTATVAFWTNPPYWIDFYKNRANGNEPPRIKFSPTGPELIGPPTSRFDQTLSATVGQPLELRLWAADQPPTNTTAESVTGPGAGRGGRGGRQTRRGDEEPPPAIIGGRVFPGGLTPLPAGGAAAAAAERAGERRADIRVIWKKYRGPGEVKVKDEAIALFNEGDANRFLEAVTTATFSAPGEYWLRAQMNDSSGDGGGGDQCCWTTAHVVVNVK
jgi:hypothetical protein